MKKFKILTLILAMIMALSVMAGCGDNEATNVDNSAGVNSGNNETSGELSDESTSNEKENSGMPEKLTAEKVGTIDKYFSSWDTGLVYNDDAGNYGIMSLDGKNDTGAIYEYCEPEGQFFAVTTSVPTNINDLKGFNSVGLVDVNGKELIPAEYGAIAELNDRYFRVTEITGITDTKDNGLVYISTSNEMFGPIFPDDDDIFLKGNWYIYDIVAGKKVDGVTGTMPYSATAHGNYIKYVNDSEEWITVNAEGKALPEGADLFDNGYYAIETDTEGTVYDSDDKKLFTYDPDGLTPFECFEGFNEGYICASKYESSNVHYAFMDKTGKLVTPEFDSNISLYGKMIFDNSNVYDLKGNQLVEGTFEYAHYDDDLGSAMILENGNERTMITDDGTVVYSGTEEGDLYFDTVNFLISDKKDGKTVYYSLKDKDFTIEGSAFTPWIVKTSSSSLVDTISGETLIEGYIFYRSAGSLNSGLYVYAETENGTFDVYVIK